MRYFKKMILPALLCLTLAVPAMADHDRGKHKGHAYGHDKQDNWKNRYKNRDRDRGSWRDDDDDNDRGRRSRGDWRRRNRRSSRSHWRRSNWRSNNWRRRSSSSRIRYQTIDGRRRYFRIVDGTRVYLNDDQLRNYGLADIINRIG